MSDYTFKVYVYLAGTLEIIYLRQFIDPVGRYFDKFMAKLTERFNILTKQPFQIMWIDEEFDEIAITNEDDLRVFMALKEWKIFVYGDIPFPRLPFSCSDSYPFLRVPYNNSGNGPWQRYGVGYIDKSVQNDNEMSGTIGTGSTLQDLQLVGAVNVQCNKCNSPIFGPNYTCLNCPDYDLSFLFDMKKLHCDRLTFNLSINSKGSITQDLMATVEKRPLDSRDASHRGTHKQNVISSDITDETARNVRSHCNVQPANEAHATSINAKDKMNPNYSQQIEGLEELRFELLRVVNAANRALASARLLKSNTVPAVAQFVKTLQPVVIAAENALASARSLKSNTIPAVGQSVNTLEPVVKGVTTPASTQCVQLATFPPDSPVAVVTENVQQDDVTIRDEIPSPPKRLVQFATFSVDSPVALVAEKACQDEVTIRDKIQPPSDRLESSPTEDWTVVNSFGRILTEPENDPLTIISRSSKSILERHLPIPTLTATIETRNRTKRNTENWVADVGEIPFEHGVFTSMCMFENRIWQLE